MGTIAWGILGAARIAERSLIPGIEQSSNCVLSAVASRNAAKRAAFKDKYPSVAIYESYEELIGDATVQAVYIPLPNHLHKK